MPNEPQKKERTYTYAQFRKKFMPRCLQHCFCRKEISEKGWYRYCCRCGEREL